MILTPNEEEAMFDTLTLATVVILFCLAFIASRFKDVDEFFFPHGYAAVLIASAAAALAFWSYLIVGLSHLLNRNAEALTEVAMLSLIISVIFFVIPVFIVTVIIGTTQFRKGPTAH